MNEYFAGAISGLSCAVIGHPLETYKSNIQNKTKVIPNFYSLMKGVIPSCKSNIIQNSFIFGFNNNLQNYTDNIFITGAITGFITSTISCPFENKKIQLQNRCKQIKYFRSIEIGVFKETLGLSLFFGIYDFLRKNNINTFWAGGITGVFSWIFTYNLDVISTRMKSNYKMTYKQAFNQGNLWKGFGVCITRSFITNSIGFYVFEYCR